MYKQYQMNVFFKLIKDLFNEANKSEKGFTACASINQKYMKKYFTFGPLYFRMITQ